jgi:hypothetical protein
LKVVLLKGCSQYGALRHGIDDMAKGFAAHGDDPTVVDLAGVEDGEKLSALLERQRPADLVFSFNILGGYRDKRGRTVSDLVDAPHVVMCVDYPLVHLSRLLDTPPATAILTVDPSHVQVIDDFFGAEHFAFVGFCPHAAFGEPQPLPATAEEFLSIRPTPVLCPMSYYAPPPPPWRNYPDVMRKVFTAAAEFALTEEWVPPLAALDRALIAGGIDFSDPNHRKDLTVVRTLAEEVNEWVRAVRRQRLFEAAAKVGLPLTVYGNGYDGALARYRNIDCRGPLEAPALLREMGKSRMVVNVNANFGRGMHERVPTAMVAGAVAATDTSAYYREHYATGEDIALFRWQHLEEDLAGIRDLLDDGEALFRMAKAGQKKALAQDRWQNRIEIVLAAARAAADRRAAERTTLCNCA